MSVLDLATSRAANLQAIFCASQHENQVLRSCSVLQDSTLAARLVRITFSLPNTPPVTHYLERLTLPSPAGADPPQIHDPELEGAFGFTERLEQGIVGPVFSGTLRPVKGARSINSCAGFLTPPVPVVAKVAFHPAETQLLLHEAAIYARLSHLHGSAIPRIFGAFAGCGFTVLVMAHGDVQVDQIGALSRGQRASLYTDLERLHAGGVLHGDLRAENIVVSATDVPSIVDLSHARIHQCKGAAACEELREARAFFGLVGGL
ncbi:hypothetical protein B0H16DRAFT_1699812 [Mycena metata]|uniref:Protein kinase domain-containing protein n=1 Tax=Mycena metata TaxID=1033252 RepID=A0AAD7MKW9_9AGAR|nr:hypothetical protein B0H16DRAFT_1699812 [Mycena metata]